MEFLRDNQEGRSDPEGVEGPSTRSRYTSFSTIGTTSGRMMAALLLQRD